MKQGLSNQDEIWHFIYDIHEFYPLYTETMTNILLPLVFQDSEHFAHIFFKSH